MKSKITISLVVFVIYLSGIVMAGPQDESPDIKEIYKIFRERQDAFRKKDYKKLWQLWPEFEKTDAFDNDLEDLKLWVEDPKLVEIVCREKIADVVLITPERAFIEVIPTCLFGGYYLIKEEGRWKFTSLTHHYLVVARYLQTIAQQIREFERKYERLPNDLTEIAEVYPGIKYQIYDLFDDERKPYRFVIFQDTWKLYSLGPDSDDDGGVIIYNPENGLISGGDIVFTEGGDNKIFRETIEKFAKIKEKTG
ncbi:MAG: hypothetical protein ABIH40_05275 [Candidatus Omnitrophota bacterium]